jgi:hypothetical protein
MAALLGRISVMRSSSRFTSLRNLVITSAYVMPAFSGTVNETAALICPYSTGYTKRIKK